MFCENDNFLNTRIKVSDYFVIQGELAVAFGELLRKLWSSGRTAVPPRAFKGKLARFAPQFSGYNQHDSQVIPFFFFFLLISMVIYSVIILITVFFSL